MIDPELKDLLQKNLDSTEETLKAVKSMRSMQRWGSLLSLLKWIAIIGVSFGAYYYIEPYLNQILDMYAQVNETVTGVQNVGKSLDSATASSTDILKKLEGLLRGF